MDKLTYRLYAEVEMNREVDKDKDFLSAGGYTMKMGGREITFDFLDYSNNVDPDDRKKIIIESRDPDYDYEQSAEINKAMLERVSDISDFFIFTGEHGETDLVPKKLLNCYFYLPYEETRIGIPTNVIKKARLGCAA